MESRFNCPEDFLQENQLLRAFLYTDYEIEPHHHDLYEINIVWKGTGIHQIENASFRVKTGDVFVIPPKIVHSYYNTENLDVYHILFRRKFITDNKKEAIKVDGFLQLTEIEPFLRSSFSRAKFLHLSQNELLQLKSDLTFIEDGKFTDQNLNPLKYHTAWKILYWLSFLLCRQLHAKEKKSGHENEILHALELIHQHFGEKITIDFLCKQTFLSRSTFLRSFQNICGCSPIDYLNRYRKEQASEMIEQGTLSKTEIAHLCGFYDLSHMERMLK